jgi:hypothetical protein
VLEIAEAGLDLEVGFVHVKGTQARHKSLGELVDAADRRSGPSRWRVARARVHRAHRRGGPRVRIPPSHPRTASPKEKSRRFYGRRLPVWEETRAPEVAHLQPVSGVKLTLPHPG